MVCPYYVEWKTILTNCNCMTKPSNKTIDTKRRWTAKKIYSRTDLLTIMSNIASKGKQVNKNDFSYSEFSPKLKRVFIDPELYLFVWFCYWFYDSQLLVLILVVFNFETLATMYMLVRSLIILQLIIDNPDEIIFKVAAHQTNQKFIIFKSSQLLSSWEENWVTSIESF